MITNIVLFVFQLTFFSLPCSQRSWLTKLLNHVTCYFICVSAKFCEILCILLEIAIWHRRAVSSCSSTVHQALFLKLQAFVNMELSAVFLFRPWPTSLWCSASSNLTFVAGPEDGRPVLPTGVWSELDDIVIAKSYGTSCENL